MINGLSLNHAGLQQHAQDRGYHSPANALLGGFDPIGLLAGLSFIAFLLHALLSFLFRPQQHASLYLPQTASSRGHNDDSNAENNHTQGLISSALEFYESLNADKNRH